MDAALRRQRKEEAILAALHAATANAEASKQFDERRLHLAQAMWRHQQAAREAEETAARTRARWAEQRRQEVLREEHIAAEVRASRERSRRSMQHAERARLEMQRRELLAEREQLRTARRPLSVHRDPMLATPDSARPTTSAGRPRTSSTPASWASSWPSAPTPPRSSDQAGAPSPAADQETAPTHFPPPAILQPVASAPAKLPSFYGATLIHTSAASGEEPPRKPLTARKPRRSPARPADPDEQYLAVAWKPSRVPDMAEQAGRLPHLSQVYLQPKLPTVKRDARKPVSARRPLPPTRSLEFIPLYSR